MNSPESKNWLGRNWKWLVPVGCIGSIVLIAGFAFIIISLIFGIMKSSGVYKEAVARAQTSTKVIEAIGSPIEEGFLIYGSINVSGSRGNADIAIPISGPYGKATVYAVAEKSAGRWIFKLLDVAVEGYEGRIDLLNKPGKTYSKYKEVYYFIG